MFRMSTEDRLKLEQRLRQWVHDDTDEFPFFLGDNTIKRFADAVQTVFEAMAEAAELETENAS